MNLTRRQFLAKTGKVSIFAVSAPLIPFLCGVKSPEANQELVPHKFGIRYIEGYSIEVDEIIRIIDVLIPNEDGKSAEQLHCVWHRHRIFEPQNTEAAVRALEHACKLPRKICYALRRLVADDPYYSHDVVYGADRGFMFIRG